MPFCVQPGTLDPAVMQPIMHCGGATQLCIVGCEPHSSAGLLCVSVPCYMRTPPPPCPTTNSPTPLPFVLFMSLQPAEMPAEMDKLFSGGLLEFGSSPCIGKLEDLGFSASQDWAEAGIASTYRHGGRGGGGPLTGSAKIRRHVRNLVGARISTATWQVLLQRVGIGQGSGEGMCVWGGGAVAFWDVVGVEGKPGISVVMQRSVHCGSAAQLCIAGFEPCSS